MNAFNIADMRELARQRLPRGIFEFVDRGCEDDDAVRQNRNVWSQLRFAPRTLVDVSSRSLATAFFGRASSMPVASAPTGAAGLLWVDGEIEIARAAAKAGIPFTLSTASLTSMEAVAEQAGGTLWFQLYLWPDRSMSHELVRRAKVAGYHALVVTVDTVVQPNREYNRRNGFALPFRLGRRNAIDMLSHPSWLAGVMGRYVMRGGMPRFENFPEQLRSSMTGKTASGKPRGLPQTDSLSWQDLAELRKLWDGPLVVKGVLRPDDAVRALAAGVDGIVVSNHGGRNLDASVPPLDALPQIVDRVGKNVEVFVDGGVQRGSDVMKALALGAKGVLLGRAPLWGLAAAGGPGVDFVFGTLHDEMMRVMAYLGCRSVRDVDADLLWHPAPGLATATRGVTAPEEEAVLP